MSGDSHDACVRPHSHVCVTSRGLPEPLSRPGPPLSRGRARPTLPLC